MSMFKLNDVLICLISWGVASLFKMRGRQRGRGLTGTQNWPLSIDPCGKCHLIWGLKRDGFLTEGAQAPLPLTLSDYVSCVGLRLTAAAPELS